MPIRMTMSVIMMMEVRVIMIVLMWVIVPVHLCMRSVQDEFMGVPDSFCVRMLEHRRLIRDSCAEFRQGKL